MARGKTQTMNIFPQYTALESRTINCMAQEGKNEYTGGKIKTQGKNKDRGGKNIIYFPPVEILSSDTVTKKDCVQREKYDLISLLQFFPPYTVCESRTIIAWPKGEKIKTKGEKISYIFPSRIFVLFLTRQLKQQGKNYDIMSPIACIFFPSFP